MDKVLREQAKTDRFVQEVGHSVEYVRSNRVRVLQFVGLGILLIALGIGLQFYRSSQHRARQADLKEALLTQDAQVGGANTNPTARRFNTATEKTAAVTKAFNNVISKHPNSMEAAIAHFYLGTISADQGKLDEAATHLKQTIDSGEDAYASQAKLSLAQVYQAQNKMGEAEKLFRSLIDKPTILVSKEQATVALARMLATTKPAEARKLLEPLRTQQGAVSRVVLSLLSELPAAAK